MSGVGRIRHVGAIYRSFLSTGANFTYIPPVLAGLSEEQVKRAHDSDHNLRTKHTVLEAALDPVEKDTARRKRMIYRSKQRGWLEADILMGSWAAKNVPDLSSTELDEYETILKEETIDIFNYITGKDPLPSHLQGLSLMKKLQEYALASKVTDPERYASIKKTTNLT